MYDIFLEHGGQVRRYKKIAEIIATGICIGLHNVRDVHLFVCMVGRIVINKNALHKIDTIKTSADFPNYKFQAINFIISIIP